VENRRRPPVASQKDQEAEREVHMLPARKIPSSTIGSNKIGAKARAILLSLGGMAVAGVLLGASPAMARDRHDVRVHDRGAARVYVDRGRAIERYLTRDRVVSVCPDNGDNDASSIYTYGDNGQAEGVADGAPCDDTPVNCPPPVDPLVQRNAVRDSMDQVQARLKADMEASPEWDQMSADVSQALSDLESARARIEATLNGRADYRAAVAQKQEAQEMVDQMQASGDPSPEETTPIAQQELAAGKEVTQLQTQLLANDPQWTDARARLQASAAGRDAMQRQLHADLLNDPQWQAARQVLDAT
jgi:hypothetical protein